MYIMSVMSELFGEYYQAKIIEIILENYEEEMTIKDIMKMAETSQGSTYGYIKFLVDKKILIESRKIGKTQLYRLNVENNITKALLLFEHNLVTSELDKKIEQTKEEKIEWKIGSLVDRIVYSHYKDSLKYSKKITIEDISPYIKSKNITKKDVEKWLKVTT